MKHVVAACLIAIVCFVSAPDSPAQTPKLKTLNDHFPFEVPASVEGWNRRSEALKRRVLVATGLWPMPDRTKITPVIHGKIRRDGFTVEKVYFESLPGHFVTGMLFRPDPESSGRKIDGLRPAVLSPHGHGGRTMRLSDDELAKQIESGGEVFERSGRYPKLARCAQLARMGCVTFIFDMLGYADSQQIDYKTAHRHANPRPEESDRDRPCFFSIDADLQLQSIMGLQTWNAIRALDFLAGLPDVDPQRLGVTGGSGGGTQTILLGAIDPRVKVGFPNGMVSTSMQGGCYCENCNYLRIGTGNVELAALFAPKPQGMTAAKDWTRAMLTDGYPQLQQLYEMLGEKDNVMCGDLLKFPHNYNYITRSMMYPWIAKHLALPESTPLVEQDFRPFSEDEMTVWTDEHPMPKETGVDHERKVLSWWSEQSSRKLSGSIPNGASDSDATARQLSEYRRLIGGAWRVIFDRTLPSKKDLTIDLVDQKRTNGRQEKTYRIEHANWNTTVNVVVDEPDSGRAASQVIVAQTGDRRDKPESENARLVYPTLDAEGQTQPLIDDKRNYSAFTFGYNRPTVVRDFERLLCVIAAFSETADIDTTLATDSGELVASTAAAAIVAGEQVTRLEIAPNGFRFAKVTQFSDRNFVPGSTKYLDLPGLLSLRAPHPMKIIGESESSMNLVRQVYDAANASDELAIE